MNNSVNINVNTSRLFRYPLSPSYVINIPVFRTLICKSNMFRLYIFCTFVFLDNVCELKNISQSNSDRYSNREYQEHF